MANLYSSALTYIGVAVQSAVGTPASAPTVILPIMRAQTRHLEWLEGRQPEDYATGDYFTEVDAPIVQPHSEGTLVMPAKLSQLNSFLAMIGVPGGSSPVAIVPPSPMTIFQGLGLDEEVYSDVFAGPVATFSCPENGNATWSIPLVGLTPPTAGTFRTVTYPAFEVAWKMHNLQPVTLIGAATIKRFNQFTANIILDSIPVYYSRGDGLPQASDILLNKLGGYLSWRRAYNSAAERTAFLAACGQPGVVDFPFQSVCSVTNTLEFKLPNGLYQKRTVDAPDRSPVGELFDTRGLRNTSGAPAGILVGYS